MAKTVIFSKLSAGRGSEIGSYLISATRLVKGSFEGCECALGARSLGQGRAKARLTRADSSSGKGQS